MVNWECSCLEVQKTGVPCPHLIFLAQSDTKKSFMDFFNSRWRKDVPEMNRHPLKWIKK